MPCLPAFCLQVKWFWRAAAEPLSLLRLYCFHRGTTSSHRYSKRQNTAQNRRKFPCGFSPPDSCFISQVLTAKVRGLGRVAICSSEQRKSLSWFYHPIKPLWVRQERTNPFSGPQRYTNLWVSRYTYRCLMTRLIYLISEKGCFWG